MSAAASMQSMHEAELAQQQRFASSTCVKGHAQLAQNGVVGVEAAMELSASCAVAQVQVPSQVAELICGPLTGRGGGT